MKFTKWKYFFFLKCSFLTSPFPLISFFFLEIITQEIVIFSSFLQIFNIFLFSIFSLFFWQNHMITSDPQDELECEPPNKRRKMNSISLVTGNAGKLREFKAILSSIVDIKSVDVDLPELQGGTPIRITSKRIRQNWKNFLLLSVGEIEEISIQKCRMAMKEVSGPIIIEDTSLCFTALGGLPGPYIKWFLQKTGHDGLNNLLVAYEDKSASAVCCLSYFDGREGSEPIVFVGETKGKIVPPRGMCDLDGWECFWENGVMLSVCSLIILYWTICFWNFFAWGTLFLRLTKSEYLSCVLTNSEGPNKFGWDPVFQPDGSTKTFAEMDGEEKNAISHRRRAIEKLIEHLNAQPSAWKWILSHERGQENIYLEFLRKKMKDVLRYSMEKSREKRKF